MKVYVSNTKDKEFFEECDFFQVHIIDMKNFDDAIKEHLDEESIFCDKGFNFTLSAHGIKQLLDRIKCHEFDVFYLSRWLDACDRNKEVCKFDDYKIVTSSAYGSGVIYFSESSIEKLKDKGDMKYSYFMSDNIQFNCLSSFPLIAQFDPSKATNKNQMVKCCLCRSEEEKKECCAQGCHSYGAFWFVLAFVIVVALLILMFNCITCEDFASQATCTYNIGCFEFSY